MSYTISKYFKFYLQRWGSYILYRNVHSFIHSFIYLFFHSLIYLFKHISPHSAECCFLFQFPVSSRFLKVIQ